MYKKLNSSRISKVWYEDNILTVEFPNGIKYRYFGVPLNVVLALTQAASPGSYFQQNIVKKAYKYEKVEKPD
jgi:hypothetical protein